MFLGVNIPARPILLAIDLRLLGLRQTPIMRRHIALLFLDDMVLLLFQFPCLFRSQLTALDPIGNTILLTLFAGIHFVHSRMIRVINSGACALGVGVLGEARNGKHSAKDQGSD